MAWSQNEVRTSGCECVSGTIRGPSSQLDANQSATCGCSAGPCSGDRIRSGVGGQEPVPVQFRHVLGGPGGGVPAEQVVVVLADLAGGVVVANVVEVGLRQRSVSQAEDQEHDPQAASLASLWLSPTSDGHIRHQQAEFVPFIGKRTALGSRLHF